MSPHSAAAVRRHYARAPRGVSTYYYCYPPPPAALKPHACHTDNCSQKA